MPDDNAYQRAASGLSIRARAKTHRRGGRPPFECIALLLQGGGALGSYQAGVYEALAEADLHPDRVAGISIGAINSAIIAGNAPTERVAKLRAFWQEITANPLLGWAAALNGFAPKGNLARGLCNQLSAASALFSGAPASLRGAFQGLRVFASRHGGALARRLPRRRAHVASSGSAGAAVESRRGLHL